MTDLNVTFKLERIHCHDEGDGPGDAEPYLWTVFFKVDGETLVVNSEGPSAPFVQGAPTVVPTPGNHGNLGTTDVDEGDDVTVPAIIGEWHTVMRPIPLTTPILGVSEVGGMIGCIVVLMEEDFTPSADIARGHDAFDSKVRDKLAEVIATLGIGHTEPTEEEIEEITEQIGDAVRSAIGDGVNVFEWLVGFGNMDDQIGSDTFRFSHSQLEGAGGMPIPFRRRWRSEGDWEIFGRISAIPIPRPESKCCEELRGHIKKLEAVIAAHEKRLVGLEKPKVPAPAIKSAAARRPQRAASLVK
jgi:hypothetical protein